MRSSCFPFRSRSSRSSWASGFLRIISGATPISRSGMPIITSTAPACSSSCSKASRLRVPDLCYNKKTFTINPPQGGRKMKATRLLLAVFISAVLLSGCIYAHVLSPLDMNVDKTMLGQKVGKASSFSVLGLVAWGDASAAAAAKSGGVTTVNHMDHEFLNIFFGFYTESTTIVYGD